MRTKIQKRNQTYQLQVKRLLDEWADTDDAVLNMSALDGGWSAIQTMHHLILTEELSLQYVRKKLSFDPKLEKVDFSTMIKQLLLRFYLNVPIKFKAPDAVGDQSLPGFTTLADTRSRWMKVRQEWTQFLEQMPAELEDKAVYKHPLAGRLGWTGMLAFFQYHLERHEKQIRRTMGR